MAQKTILIIDDDEHLLLALKPKLSAQGFGVLTATDATTAIEIACSALPDLVILDLGIPTNDGVLDLEKMRERTELSAIPVIVLSARSPELHERKALEDGAIAFFHKPPENHELLGVIRQALGIKVELSAFLTT